MRLPDRCRNERSSGNGGNVAIPTFPGHQIAPYET